MTKLKKVLPLIFLLLPVSLICQEHYELVYLKYNENDSIIYDGDCNEILVIYDDVIEKRMIEKNHTLQMIIEGEKNDSGYTMLRHQTDPPTNWLFKISTASEVFGEKKLENKDDENPYIIEFIYYNPNDTNTTYILYFANKKNVIPKNKLTIENMNLSVSEYIYIDSLGYEFSEKEFAEKGIRGHYSSLSIKCDNDNAVFTFKLKKQSDNRSLLTREEVYNYKIAENFMEDGFEYWILERKDGARLIFKKNNSTDTYSLTIPADKTAETLYVYIFTRE